MNLNADDVLREALKIKAEGLATAEGAYFPEGTIFLTFYKDKPYTATVKEGQIRFEGVKQGYTSVSAAAAHVTGRATTNGWAFWMIRLPGSNKVEPIASFKKDK